MDDPKDEVVVADGETQPEAGETVEGETSTEATEVKEEGGE